MHARAPWNAGHWKPSFRPSPQEIRWRLERTLQRQAQWDADRETHDALRQEEALSRSRAASDGVEDVRLKSRTQALADASSSSSVRELLSNAATAKSRKASSVYHVWENNVFQPQLRAICDAVQANGGNLRTLRQQQYDAFISGRDPTSATVFRGMTVRPSEEPLDYSDPCKVSLMREVIERSLINNVDRATGDSVLSKSFTRPDLLHPVNWAAKIAATPHGHFALNCRQAAGEFSTLRVPLKENRVATTMNHFEITESTVSEFPRGKRSMAAGAAGRGVAGALDHTHSVYV